MPGPAFRMGETVALHPWEDEDADFYHQHRNSAAVRRPLTDVSPRTRHQVTEHFEEGIYDDGDDEMDFLVCTGPAEALRTGDADAVTRVGQVAIPWINRPHDVGMLMYWSAPAEQGNGYVTEATRLLLDHAFGERRLHKVWAMVVEPNDASRAVLEKLGFEQEGHYREETFYEGRYVDARRYAILAEEWLDGA
ncbi:GNAT family N-acetyltransferase [Halorhabdus amylolytica]|uniref:GNAT family N-acetyltransferase n=1 Tax=Halorhabdus amylolytica TaxID=2559573 RepID=UPI0010AA0A73|nr:GNAT family protein [Halorhabdus amylolytica]